MPGGAGKVLEPKHFREFRCVGAECVDTCCEGWGIAVDRATYERYQAHPDRVVREQLNGWVTIHPASPSASTFARMQLDGVRCRALEQGWCAIQRTLGEPYLSDMCSTFPRVLNEVNGVMERSLHLSCPEAARLVLSDPEPVVFDAGEEEAAWRAGSVSTIEVGSAVMAMRKRVVVMLQDRSRPLWQRLALVGGAVEAWGTSGGELQGQVADVVPEPGRKLEAVIELVVGRISAEYAPPRFLACYGEFMRGLEWNEASTMEELAGRYGRVLSSPSWKAFEQAHGHVFENFLVHLVFRTLFPFGHRGADQKLTIKEDGAAVRDEYALLAASYAIVRTLAVGMAGCRSLGEKIDAEFGLERVVTLIQSFTKTFQHSQTFPASVTRFVEERRIGRAGELSFLFAE